MGKSYFNGFLLDHIRTLNFAAHLRNCFFERYAILSLFFGRHVLREFMAMTLDTNTALDNTLITGAVWTNA